MPRVTVMRDKFARSWPERHNPKTGEIKPLRDSDRAYVLDLGKALERPYSSDAHLAAYATHNGYRLNCDAFEHGVAVEMTCAIFDIDGPGHGATPEWRREIRERVRALAEVHKRPFYYETNGGCRVVHVLPEPIVLRTKADAHQWSQQYAVAVAYLKRRFGIVADPTCCDWQRLERLPRATRDGVLQNHPTWGDPHNIGALHIQATPADIEAARQSDRSVMRAHREIDLRPSGNGDGLFYHLLRNRGDIGEEAPRGGKSGRAWIARCPNRANHRDNSDGTEKTICYAPAAEKSLGMIHCYRGSCHGISGKDWLRFFSDSEIEAAGKAAGLVRA